MNYRQAILHLVTSYGGIKGVDLSIRVMGEINPTKWDSAQYNEALEKLIEEGEIVEICYILPQMDYRLKSIYFPKGTKVGSQTEI